LEKRGIQNLAGDRNAGVKEETAEARGAGLKETKHPKKQSVET